MRDKYYREPIYGDKWLATHAQARADEFADIAEEVSKIAGHRLDRIRELEDRLAQFESGVMYEVRCNRIMQAVGAGYEAALRRSIEDMSSLTGIPAAMLAARYQSTAQKYFTETVNETWSSNLQKDVEGTLEDIASNDLPQMRVARRMAEGFGADAMPVTAEEWNLLKRLTEKVQAEITAQVSGPKGTVIPAMPAYRYVQNTRPAKILPVLRELGQRF
jgi:hypothetical protein